MGKRGDGIIHDNERRPGEVSDVRLLGYNGLDVVRGGV
jgi:hypothetical protein